MIFKSENHDVGMAMTIRRNWKYFLPKIKINSFKVLETENHETLSAKGSNTSIITHSSFPSYTQYQAT